jgi:hypothetical protein
MDKMDRMEHGQNGVWTEWSMGRMEYGQNGVWTEWNESLSG